MSRNPSIENVKSIGDRAAPVVEGDDKGILDQSTNDGDVSGRSSPSIRHRDKEEGASRHSRDHDEGEDDEDKPPVAEEEHPVSPVRSRASSTRSRTLSIVPRSKRRGWLGSLTVIPEVDRPYDYTNRTKWTITSTVALAGAVAPMGSAIFYPVLGELAHDLNASQTITNLSIAMYMIAMSVFPLWWSSLSEEFGRRTIYIACFGLFVIFSVLSAVSTNITMLIVMRLLGGGCSASVHAVGAGTIADVWEVRERGRAMSMFYLGPLLGPLLAPIIGGVLAEGFGWRSTMWFVAAYGALVLLLLILLLPETLAKKKTTMMKNGTADAGGPEGSSSDVAPTPLTRHASSVTAVSVHTKRLATLVKKFLLDPLSVLLMLRFPAVALTTLYAAITFGSLFVLNISIQDAFTSPPYSFDVLIVGLLYLAPSMGYLLASLFGGRWIDRIMAREAEKAGRYDDKGRPIYLPEDRFKENAWIASTIYPCAFIIYGWTVTKGVHWIVPSIANFVFGVGSMLVFTVATTALTEFVPKKSSAGVAVNNFVRNIFSCVGAIIAQPMINAIGNGWVFTILGCVTLVLGYLIIWVLKKKSPEWRKALDKANA